MNISTRSGDDRLVRNRRARNACAGLLGWCLACGLASVAQAQGPVVQDYCLSFPIDSTYVLVGKEFTVPRPGHCATWRGYTYQEVTNSPSSGTACLSSDGSDLAFSITTDLRMYVLFDHVDLTLPGAQGTVWETLLGFGGAQSAVANGGTCKGNTIPDNPPYDGAMTGLGRKHVGLMELPLP